MKLIKILTLLFLMPVGTVYGQSEIPRYHTQTDFLLTSPGAMWFGLYGYANPALLIYLHQPDLLFAWSDASGKGNGFDRWGLFAAMPTPNFGFGMIHQKNTPGSVTDYRLSLAFGDRRRSFGIGYGWSRGDTRLFNRASVITLGSLLRPIPQLSIGKSAIFATSGSAKEGMIDLAIRPLGNEMVTLFADYALGNDEKLKDGHWSTGLAVEALPGIRFTARYFDTEEFTIGLNFSLGRIGATSQAHYDKTQKHSYNTYGVRIGASDRNVFRTYLFREKNYVELNLLGRLKYQRYKLFDKSNTLAELVSIIDGAKEDKTVSGIAINTSGMRINQEMAWELREKLRDFKSVGKHVIIYLDQAYITDYHFASVADNIVLDPTGLVFLEGFVFGRAYFKGTLEKIGIGVDEWRYFKYKSAAETFSRDRMSDADREQWQKLVDDYYYLAKSDICEARSITSEEFDRLVNKEGFFLAQDALEKGLVDTLGRWEAVKNMIKNLEGKEKAIVSPGSIGKYQLPKDNYWGEKPQIAIIYAVGVCAMDEGIAARKLVKDVDGAMKNPKIKAVVFRVDSPGGEATPSDIVAEALKKCKEKKPVIVSQGFWAGSGGYWLSMYGDTIVAAPNTITGSIGVIGYWFYDKGIKEKLGVSSDLVKVGEHADFEFGIRWPLLGLIHDRNLNDDERAKAERMIKSSYKEFVEKVASGRKRQYEEIESVAQGRVWSGYDGKQNGLVDVLGGLETAMMIAKEKAGIPKHQEVKIVEFPEPSLFNPNIFTPKLFGVEYQENKFIEHLRFRLKHNGEPMPMLPMEYMDMLMELNY